MAFRGMTRRKRYSPPRSIAGDAEAEQIAAYLHENHVILLPPAAAHILGESSPGWRRTVEAKATPGKPRARRLQQQLAKRFMPDMPDMPAEISKVPYRRKADADRQTADSYRQNHDFIPELRKSPRQAVQAETKDRTTSPGTETTSPSQQGKKPT